MSTSRIFRASRRDGPVRRVAALLAGPLAALAVLFAASLPSACTRTPAAAQPDLIILQTGRLRGGVFPLDGGASGAVPYYAHIAGYVHAVRAEAQAIGADVLLVDLGDSLDGSFTSFMTGSANMTEFFNRLGYDVVALGNLDSAVTEETLERFEMPVLCPFVDAAGGVAAPGATPHALIRKPRAGDIAVVANFFGSVDPATNPALFPTSFGGSDDVAPRRDFARLAESTPGWREASLRLLTWMKFEPTGAATPGFARQLADEGVDLVLAHRILERGHGEGWQVEAIDGFPLPLSMNILRRNSGFALARTDLKMSDDGWEVTSSRLVPMNAHSAPPDREMTSLINQLFADVMAQANVTLTTLPERLTRESLLDAAHAALADAARAHSPDATLYSPTSVRIDIQPGALRLGDLYDALPWTDPVVLIELPRDKAAALAAAQGLDLRVLGDEAPSPESPTLRVATSRFFANLMRQAGDVENPPKATVTAERPLFLLVADAFRGSRLPEGASDGEELP